MGYVHCAACGYDTLGEPNSVGLTFCTYCVEYAQEHGDDITGEVSESILSAMFHNVEGD